MKNFFQKYDSLIWAVVFLVFAFIFSTKLHPMVGVIVFVAFFTLSVGMVMKFFDEQKKGKGGG